MCLIGAVSIKQAESGQAARAAERRQQQVAARIRGEGESKDGWGEDGRGLARMPCHALRLFCASSVAAVVHVVRTYT